MTKRALLAFGLVVSLAVAVWLATSRSPSHDVAAENEAADEIARLRSLPYAEGVPVAADDAHREGLVQHDPRRSQPGLTLFDLAGANAAMLVENDGTVVHRWHFDDTSRRRWQHVRLLPEGDLLAVTSGRQICRIDREGRLRWKLRGEFHHELHLGPDGAIWTARTRRTTYRDRWPILDEEIVRISLDGEVLGQTSLLPLFEGLLTPPLLDAIEEWMRSAPRRPLRAVRPDTPTDVFHLNRVEVLRQPLEGVAPAGSVLVSLCARDTLAVLSPALDRVLWSWGPGELEGQHLPRQLDGRRLLVFDNGSRRGYSRLLEVEPASNRIVWSWTAEPRADFSTVSRGGAQRLPNGNTLAVESDAGRIFEIAPDGERVWEFLLPLRRGGPDAMGRERHAVYRAHRFTGVEEEEIRRWLATPPPDPTPAAASDRSER